MKTKHVTLPALVLGVLFSFNSCKKEDKDAEQINSVSTTQKVFVTEFTATWCHVCGESGGPALEAAITKHPNKVVAICAHAGGSFNINEEVQAEKDLSDFYDVTGIPDFVVGVDEGAYYTSAGIGDVDSYLSTNKVASAGVGISKSISGSSININTKTIFFKETAGTYNLAIYVTEDGVAYNQTRDTQPTPFMKTHDHILRGAANKGTWGENIVTGSATKNQEIDGTYTFTIPSTVKNNDNLHIVAVIYKMGTDGKPSGVLNANML
jgi:hypothetical protein